MENLMKELIFETVADTWKTGTTPKSKNISKWVARDVVVIGINQVP